MVIRDGPGLSLAVLETTEPFQRRFHEVDAAFAHDEGEGDRGLEYWRRAHREYFRRKSQFPEDMPLFGERFRVTDRIPPFGGV